MKIKTTITNGVAGALVLASFLPTVAFGQADVLDSTDALIVGDVTTIDGDITVDGITTFQGQVGSSTASASAPASSPISPDLQNEDPADSKLDIFAPVSIEGQTDTSANGDSGVVIDDMGNVTLNSTQITTDGYQFDVARKTQIWDETEGAGAPLGSNGLPVTDGDGVTGTLIETMVAGYWTIDDTDPMNPVLVFNEIDDVANIYNAVDDLMTPEDETTLLTDAFKTSLETATAGLTNPLNGDTDYTTSDTGAPSGGMLTVNGDSLMAGNLELGAITDVEMAIGDNTSDIAMNTSDIATNASTLVVHDGLVTQNIADIATNASTLVVHEGLVTQNITDIDALEDLIWQDGNGATHIGPDSLVTQYDAADDDQNLWAENASGDIIDINAITDINVSPAALPGTEVSVTAADGQVDPTIDPDLMPVVAQMDDTTPVYTLISEVTEAETDYTKNGGVLIETNGNVTLSGIEGSKDTIKYVTAVRADIYNADQGANAGTTAQEVRVGGYLDENGDFVELAALVDVGGQWLIDPNFDPTTEQMTVLEDLGYVVLDEDITGTGGNLHVDGDATVMGDLTVGGTNVMTAIGDNTAAIGVNATDIATNATAIADEESARMAADTALGVRVDDAEDDIAANSSAISVNASAIASNSSAISGFQSDLNSLESAMSTARMDIDTNTRGIAMVAALTHTTILPGMDNALDISMAYFEGETGISISYSRRINENTQINFAAASTSDFEESVVRGGIGWQW